MSEKREIDDPTRVNIREVCETFGLSLEVSERSYEWAKQWQDILVENCVEDTDNPVTLLFARDQALGNCPDITRDGNGDPSFRSVYAAQQLLYRNMPAHADRYRTTLEGDGLKVTPHFDQLDTIVKTLIETRERNEFPYSLEAAMLPQDERNMPPELVRGGIEHANYLWVLCYYMRGGIESTTAVSSLSKLYAKEPALFDPHNAQHDDPARITELLQENGLAFSSKFVGKAWVENARRMVERFDGDPRKLFEGTTRYDEILGRIKNTGRGRGFLGFREKMTSMIAYYLMEAEIIPYFDFPLPVDLHVLRISASQEIVTFGNTPEDGDILSEKTLGMLRDMYHDFSVTYGVSQLDVCNAVWSFSSAICNVQPGNIMLEPNKEEGRKGRSTHIIPLLIDLDSEKQQKMYNKSCGHCPIEKSCEHNMPGKEYYVKGRAILSPRVRFESDDVSLIADDATQRASRKRPREESDDARRKMPAKKAAPAAADETLF